MALTGHPEHDKAPTLAAGSGEVSGGFGDPSKEKTKMTRSRWKGVAVLLLCVGLSYLWSYQIHTKMPGTVNAGDFSEIYYGARCALKHKDPYDPEVLGQVFEAEGGKFAVARSAGPKLEARSLKRLKIVTTVEVNLPTTLFLVAPLALLPGQGAQTIWITLIAGLLLLAASLLWDLGANAAPGIWVCLAGCMLILSEGLFVAGNVAGIAVSFCIIAVWCFIKERYIPAGVLMMAISLVVKPHDAGFVWLYFLLAGGTMRKRALQTLAAAGVLAVFAAIWIAPSSPHWIQELHSNLNLVSARGSTSDPSLSGLTNGQIIDLQAAISIFSNNPHVYNAISFLICGPLIFIWGFVTLRSRPSLATASLGLAAISALTLLPVYHRPNDAKLLLLAIPACAMLWTEKGLRRWIALVLTTAGILLTSGIVIDILGDFAKSLPINTSVFSGKITALLLLRPSPLILLIMGSFYLWVYVRHSSRPSGSSQGDEGVERLVATASA